MNHVLIGAIAYRYDIPDLHARLGKWVGAGAPITTACSEADCPVRYDLIEPADEPEERVEQDVKDLRHLVEGQHPNHQPCVPVRPDSDPNVRAEADDLLSRPW